MANDIRPELKELLGRPDTVKVVITVDKGGAPHAAVKDSFRIDDTGRFIFLELLESSVTNRNLVRSLWFDKPVSVLVTGSNGASFQIKGRAVKSMVSGYEFRRYYIEARDRWAYCDLAAVWVIEPDSITEGTLSVRHDQEAVRHPYFTHLDRLAK